MSRFKEIDRTAEALKARIVEAAEPAEVLKAPELKVLLAGIKDQAPADRAEYGAAVNALKRELEELVDANLRQSSAKTAIDLTAPFDANVAEGDQPSLLAVDQGSQHPITAEIDKFADIFLRMGFEVLPSRLIDDEYHMFTSLNFPKDHPARDDYDTFMTEEGLILPAHTSTMQHRVLKSHEPPIAAVIPGRVFRNEDLDATHEHTFHQLEGLYVDEGVSLADMLGTIKTFLEAYFEEEVEYKTQPFYFPFVEPGLEYLIKRPKQLQNVKDDWLEIIGCGMIHPNVLKEAGLDPKRYSGFAWGMGIERMVMLKYGIEDVRHFMSGNLDFLKSIGGGR